MSSRIRFYYLFDFGVSLESPKRSRCSELAILAIYGVRLLDSTDCQALLISSIAVGLVLDSEQTRFAWSQINH